MRQEPPHVPSEPPNHVRILDDETKRILIADDYSVRTSCDGREAIEAPARRRRPPGIDRGHRAYATSLNPATAK